MLPCAQRQVDPPMGTLTPVSQILSAAAGSVSKQCLGLHKVQHLPLWALHQDSFLEEFLSHSCLTANLPVWSP